jgi:hypothetical protein
LRRLIQGKERERHETIRLSDLRLVAPVLIAWHVGGSVSKKPARIALWTGAQSSAIGALFPHCDV